MSEVVIHGAFKLLKRRKGSEWGIGWRQRRADVRPSEQAPARGRSATDERLAALRRV